MAEEQKQGQFVLQRVYVKDLSFEAPGAPEVFSEAWKPEVNLNLNTNARKVTDEQYEVVLTTTVTMENDGKKAFIAEVQQAGLFFIKDVEGGAIEPLLGSYCPNILFPYAREAVSDMVNRGSFPQFLMQPVNFDALFADAKKKQAEQQAEASEGSTH